MTHSTNADYLSGLDEATIAALSKAEELMEGMQGSFREEALQQVEVLKTAAADVAAAEFHDPDCQSHCQTAFQASHELRGQAGTFGYGLLTELCDSLCEVLELFLAEAAIGRAASHYGRKLRTAMLQHVVAVSTVVESDMKGDGGDLGRELSKELGRLRTHLLEQAA